MKNAKVGLTDAQVEEEIARLLTSDEVKLAKAEAREKERRRRYLYSLRCMERRGKELMALGYNEENIKKMFQGE